MDLIREELNAELLNNTGGLHNAVEEVLIGAMGVQNALHLFKKGVLIITPGEDRKSTRLNSSHLVISYAVFCLKKQKKRHNLFQELVAVLHLLMDARHWGLRKSRNVTSLHSRFKRLDKLKVYIICVTSRSVIRT